VAVTGCPVYLGLIGFFAKASQLPGLQFENPWQAVAVALLPAIPFVIFAVPFLIWLAIKSFRIGRCGGFAQLIGAVYVVWIFLPTYLASSALRRHEMATVICKTCNSTFESKMHPATTAGATVALAAGGAYVGSSVGLAAGPVGAMAGTIPGAVIGAFIGFLGASRFTKCPQCAKVFPV
jgi:hypothetical protein